ncbi:MAG: GxxExxY protein [Flavobacteriales bacterium]
MALEQAVIPTAEAHTRALVGAAMEVHTQLGPGFLEPIYQEALAVEFVLRSIPCSREVQVPVFYKGKLLAYSYRADFVCFGNVVVELKAVQLLGAKDDAQITNYLKATGHAHGLLFNFGQRRLQFKRFDTVPSDPDHR